MIDQAFDLEQVANLIRIGFHGFTVVMLFMAYNLLRSVIKARVSLLSDKPSKDFNAILKEVRVFTIMTLLFLITGVISELVRNGQENSVFITVTPPSMPADLPMPRVVKDSAVVKLKDGAGSTALRDEGHLSFQVEGLTDEIVRKNFLLGQITARCEIDEIGFGDI